MSEVIVTSKGNLRNEVRYGAGHSFTTDEPVAAGGEDAGPDPYTLLLAALGSCISMTVTLYARRKEWPLESVTGNTSRSTLRLLPRYCALAEETPAVPMISRDRNRTHALAGMKPSGSSCFRRSCHMGVALRRGS